MNNEDKILEILLQMQQEQKTTNDRLSKLETEQAEMKTELRERFDHIDKRFADMDERFDSVEFSINQAWKDLGIVEDRVEYHEDIIQKKII